MDARTPTADVIDDVQTPGGDAHVRMKRKGISPLNQRRLNNFKANGRGWWSLWIFLVLFLVTLCAEFIANDRPLIVSYKGELLFPVLVDYPEEKFGGFLAVTRYYDPFIIEEINANGWMIHAPIRYDHTTRSYASQLPYPIAPTWSLERDIACGKLDEAVMQTHCGYGTYHWLGTDDQGRDVLARLIYGFRLSVLFGLTLTLISSVIGIAAGAVQGYFGGWTDLLFQRFIEIWTSIPSLYLLLIFSAFFVPGFWTLLFILLLFSWVALVGLVRAEFLRGRNLEYVRAAQALGLSDVRIMFRHILPNAMVATITFLPFILSGSITTLTALDFLGLGLQGDAPSLGELLAQGKSNRNAPWLGLTGFMTISIMLSLLIFIGEAVRDAFDPRKVEG